jgi:hypothetical protein
MWPLPASTNRTGPASTVDQPMDALGRGDVILAAGLDVGRGLDQAQVDGRAVGGQRIGHDQLVVAIAVAQVGLVPPAPAGW